MASTHGSDSTTGSQILSSSASRAEDLFAQLCDAAEPGTLLIAADERKLRRRASEQAADVCGLEASVSRPVCCSGSALARDKPCAHGFSGLAMLMNAGLGSTCLSVRTASHRFPASRRKARLCVVKLHGVSTVSILRQAAQRGIAVEAEQALKRFAERGPVLIELAGTPSL